MKEFIICPSCGSIELAEVDVTTMPFSTLIHTCSKCNYTTMESEWYAMKALTIKNPWAYLIASGKKDIENRGWRTNFRGKVLIHCSAKSDKRFFDRTNNESYKIVCDTLLNNLTKQQYISQNSCIIGSVEIVDCVINHPSIWAEKSYYAQTNESNPDCDDDIIIWNWVLKNPILFEKPIANVKGKLSFFKPIIY